jgi:hypothetical protein
MHLRDLEDMVVMVVIVVMVSNLDYQLTNSRYYMYV